MAANTGDLLLHHEFANINGIKMHYVTIGEGPLIVFLHGFPEFWKSWKHQISFFSKKFKVVALDMRGYGETERPIQVGEYRIEKLARDVTELIDSLGQKKATVVGHDWGGAVAWATAMMNPSFVEKLIVMNAPHPAIVQRNAFRNYAQMQKSWYMFFFLLEKAPEKVLSSNNFEILKHMFEISIKRKDRFSLSDIEEYVSSWSKEGGITGGLNYYRANLNEEFWGNLGESIPFPKIKIPTLQIWAEDDMFLGKELAEGTKEFVVDAPFSLKVIPNCGHWVQQEAPEEVNQIMEEFLLNDHR
jgi:pimeloyl-ACP methyl ester carboxylesterase